VKTSGHSIVSIDEKMEKSIGYLFRRLLGEPPGRVLGMGNRGTAERKSVSDAFIL